MADARPFAVVDSAGAPLLGGVAGMTLSYTDKSGAAQTSPGITELGGGVYQVLPTDADESSGRVAFIDCGVGNEPRRVTWPIYRPDNGNQFFAFHCEDSAGALWAGAAPTFATYVDKAGAGRTPPTLTAIAGAYLYVATPSAADVTADSSGRIDLNGSPWVQVATEPTSPNAFVVAASTGMEAEQLVPRAARDYLLAMLPAKVAQLNGLRVAKLQAAYAGPYVVPGGATLRVSAVSREDTGTLVTLPTGASVTAAAIATAINTAAPTNLVASADALGRLVLTSTVAPAQNAPSVVVVRADSTNANVVFGWEAGGEHVLSQALVAPGWRGVTDGWPTSVPDMGRSFWVILGDRSSVPLRPEARRDEVDVALDVTVMLPTANMAPNRNREDIAACVRACRELLTTTEGRYLGRIGAGDVQWLSLSKVAIPGKPFAIAAQGIAPALFDAASFTLTVRVFQRPAS